MKKYVVVLLFIFIVHTSYALLMPLDDFIDFIIEQKQNSKYYKQYPITVIKNVSWMLGYGKIKKDDLTLLDRLPFSRDELRAICTQFPIDIILSKERYALWHNKKRKHIIKELRSYTAEQCNTTESNAYGAMRNPQLIKDDRYFALVIQNLHDLCYFIRNIE